MTAATAAVAMDRIYRHQRYVYNATRAYYLLGRDQLIAELDAGPGTTVLEIACGTARNIFKAAELYPQAQFYGIDVSSEMLTTARRSAAKSPNGSRVALAYADATSFDPMQVFGTALFDRIFISYAVSMIPRWEAVIDQALGLLATGGTLHIVDFGTMDGLPRAARSGLLAWLAKFEVTPRPDLEDICAAAASRHGMTSSFRQSQRGYWASAVIKRA